MSMLLAFGGITWPRTTVSVSLARDPTMQSAWPGPRHEEKINKYRQARCRVRHHDIHNSDNPKLKYGVSKQQGSFRGQSPGRRINSSSHRQWKDGQETIWTYQYYYLLRGKPWSPPVIFRFTLIAELPLMPCLSPDIVQVQYTIEFLYFIISQNSVGSYRKCQACCRRACRDRKSVV